MPKPVFLGGEIRPKYRGRETVVVTRERKGSFSVFQYGEGSAEFIRFTGLTRAVQSPVERIYLGISREGADIVTATGLQEGTKTVDQIDRELVIPYFLQRSRAEHPVPAN